MDGARPYASPVVASNKFSLYDGDPLEDSSEYRNVVGALQYLFLTQPDIVFFVVLLEH